MCVYLYRCIACIFAHIAALGSHTYHPKSHLPLVSNITPTTSLRSHTYQRRHTYLPTQSHLPLVSNITPTTRLQHQHHTYHSSPTSHLPLVSNITPTTRLGSHTYPSSPTLHPGFSSQTYISSQMLARARTHSGGAKFSRGKATSHS